MIVFQVKSLLQMILEQNAQKNNLKHSIRHYKIHTKLMINMLERDILNISEWWCIAQAIRFITTLFFSYQTHLKINLFYYEPVESMERLYLMHQLLSLGNPHPHSSQLRFLIHNSKKVAKCIVLLNKFGNIIILYIMMKIFILSVPSVFLCVILMLMISKTVIKEKKTDIWPSVSGKLWKG